MACLPIGVEKSLGNACVWGLQRILMELLMVIWAWGR